MQQISEEEQAGKEKEPTEEELVTSLCEAFRGMLNMRGAYLNRGKTSTWRAFTYQHILTIKETIEDLEKYYC